MGYVTRLAVIMLSLWMSWTSTAQALSGEGAETCVQNIAEEMQSLPQGNFRAYERFAYRHVNIEAITAIAMSDRWQSMPGKRELWKEAALIEITRDIIGTLRNIRISNISRIITRHARRNNMTYYIVSGIVDDIEVIVHVDMSCKVIEAIAAQVRASSRIRDRIQTMYPED